MLSLAGRSKTKKSTVLPPEDILFDISNETCDNFARLCFLMTNCGTIAFQIFIKGYSSEIIQFTNWLRKPEIHLSLRRLKCQGFLSIHQWNSLYSDDKESILFPPSDLSLLILILKYTGIVAKPEPNGWMCPPLTSDQSSGAFLVKFLTIRRQLATATRIDSEIYQSIQNDIRTILTHFGGRLVEEKLESFAHIEFSPEEMIKTIEYFKMWHKEEEKIFQLEQKLDVSRNNRQFEIPILQKPIIGRETSSKKSQTSKQSVLMNTFTENIENNMTKSNIKWSDIKFGIAEEEKEILRKFHSRLISEVRPDSMIDQLLTKKVLNIEESGEIFSSLNSSDQMNFLLDVLVMKSGQAFNEFLNALKSRYFELYLDIYEDYQRMKQEILANKPEGVSYCQAYLINYFIKTYSQWSPIQWYPDCLVNLQSFYCPLQILDSNGTSVDPVDVLNHKTQKLPSRLVVIEGDPGTGKSYLSHYIASKWANDPYIFGSEPVIKLVFHLDLKITAPNLKWMLLDQIFNTDLKLTERELWEVIEKHQEICLFILDGYNDNINDEVFQLISGTLFPSSHLLIFSNSASTHLLKGYFQEKLVLTGFAYGESIDFINKYINLSTRPYEMFEGVIQKLSKTIMKSKMTKAQDNDDLSKQNGSRASNQNDDLSSIPEGIDHEISFISKQRAGSVVAGALMGFTKSGAVKLNKPLPEGNISRNVRETAEEVQSEGLIEPESNTKERLMALRFYSQFPLYCSFFCLMTDLKLSIDLTSWSAMLEHFFTAIKMKLIERERESRFSVNKMFNTLIELAFESIKQGLATTFVKESDRVTKFGVLRKTLSNNSNLSSKFVFNNDIVQNFLAAKCLDLYGLEEANNFFQNITITKSMSTLIIFYCGIRRNDFETAALRTLFKKIIDLNLQILITDSDTVYFSKSKSRPVNIMKFQLSLECVAAMSGRNDLALKVGQTLPERLLIEHNCTIPVLTLQGLSFIIDLGCKNIKELDIRLNYLSRQTPEAFQNIANSIHHNTTIKILRIFWEELELMSAFLCKVCEKNQSIATIECFDESNHKYDNFSSSIASNIRNACRNMKNVEGFAFNDCTFSSLNHAIIRNIPDNLTSLDLSGSSFTIIACKDLAEKIIQSKSLRILKMEKVQIQSMAFNTLIRSFCDNRSIVELNLNGIKMDNVCFFSLAESLKLNNKLEKLFLLDVTINEHNCSELGQVLRVNTTLKELHVTENRIPFPGQTELQKHAKNTKIIGLQKMQTKLQNPEKDVDIFNF